MLVVGDGMADYPVPELGNLTPLQVAYKPKLDEITSKGRSGLIKNVPDDLNPGSENAILSLLGYDPHVYCTGRGPLEAPARGITLKTNDIAFRCNLITEKDGVLVDYSAGHVTTREAIQLIEAVNKSFARLGLIEFHTGLDYRHFLVLRNNPKAQNILCTPPHDVSGARISGVLPRAKFRDSEEVASGLRDMIIKSKALLDTHPVNISRISAGLLPANMIWPWGGGPKPTMPSFKKKYGLSSAVVSAVDMVKGIGYYAGMRVLDVLGATGLANTNYEGKAETALKALEKNDFVFVHVEAPDEAGHARDHKLKIKTIEDFDRRLLSRILEGLSEPFSIAILPDHPTPIKVGTHTRDPVPFTISSPFLSPDGVKKFDEISARDGAYGKVTDVSLMSLFLQQAFCSK